MRIYKNDIIKASAISTGADRGVLLCSITDSGFTSIAGVISAVKDRLPNEDHKKMVFEILNDTKKEYGRYNNCGTKVFYTGIPEGSEHLFKDIYTAKADELYHHVLDKFGWAWRDPKYKSETELCAMLKWAKEKGLTIEELSI